MFDAVVHFWAQQKLLPSSVSFTEGGFEVMFGYAIICLVA